MQTPASQSFSDVIDQSISAIPSRAFYKSLKLRLDVFTGEQGIEWGKHFDDIDIAAETCHLSIQADNDVVSYLRLSKRNVGLRIERVATSPAFRGRGFASKLNRYAVSATEAKS